MKKKSIILLATIPSAIGLAGLIAGVTYMAVTAIKQMKVEEITKTKEITCDSDKEAITYKFKQEVTKNYSQTKVTLVDFKVHNKSEEEVSGLITPTLKEDGTVDVVFNTPLFISQYLVKYYELGSNDYIPTTYKFRLFNEADRTEYVSSEFKITVTPAEYLITCSSMSAALHLPDDQQVKVYYPYQAQYKIEDKYSITKRSIMRYDGLELCGLQGVKFEDGEIYIPWPYVTGPIVITADAQQTTFNVDKIGLHVTYKNIPDTIELNKPINGTFTIDAGFAVVKESCGVWVGDQKLTDGYKIDFDQKTISIDANKVTDNITIYIATNEDKCSVGYQGNHVSFGPDKPTEVAKHTQISTTYTIDSGYELDASTTYVTVDGVKQTSGYSIADGKIVINAAIVTGNIVINVGTKEMPTVLVTATGGYYIEFAKPQKAYKNKEYKLTYKLVCADSIKTVDVKVGTTTLTKDQDYTCANGVLTIKENVINDDTITITATGNPKNFSFHPDFDDRIYVVSTTNPINYMVDFKCTIGLYMEAGTVTNWGCAVSGDERYTEYLQYDSATKTFTLPGKYVKGDIKIWASLA